MLFRHLPGVTPSPYRMTHIRRSPERVVVPSNVLPTLSRVAIVPGASAPLAAPIYPRPNYSNFTIVPAIFEQSEGGGVCINSISESAGSDKSCNRNYFT
jgi:hypothetical protein